MKINYSFIFCFIFSIQNCFCNDLIQLKKNFDDITKSLKKLHDNLGALPKPKPIGKKPEAFVSYNIDRITVSLVKQDITEINVDVIVNVVNQDLSNVDVINKGIWNKAGVNKLNDYVEQLKKTGQLNLPLEIGDGFITPSFDLEKVGIKHIIHVTGPNCMGKGDNLSDLKKAYETIIEKANSIDAQTVATVPISLMQPDMYYCPIDSGYIYTTEGIKDIQKKIPSLKVRTIYIYMPDDWTTGWFSGNPN